VAWGRGRPNDRRELPAAFTAQGEPFLAVKPFSTFVVDDKAFGFEKVMKDGRTPSRLESGPVTQSFPHRGVVALLDLILKAGSVPACDAADTALRKPKAGDGVIHGGSACFGL